MAIGEREAGTIIQKIDDMQTLLSKIDKKLDKVANKTLVLGVTTDNQAKILGNHTKTIKKNCDKVNYIEIKIATLGAIGGIITAITVQIVAWFINK